MIPDNDIPSSSSTTATTAPTGTATAPNQDIILAADGQQNTDPFTLVEGSYSVQFDLRGACFYGADLTRLTPDSESALPTTITTGQGPVAGTTNLYDIDAGDYYIGMLTGPTPTCPWSIVLTRHTATP